MKKNSQRVSKRLIILMFLGCFLFAVIWPFIYPGLDFILAFIGLSESLVHGFVEFGALYGKLSPTAPEFFKGMAKAHEQLKGEHPALAHLSYMEKAALVAGATYPAILIEILVFILVSVVALLSRVLFWESAKAVARGVATVLAFLPLTVILLSWIGFFLFNYIQAWSSGGILSFGFLVLLFPAVIIRVVSLAIGLFFLARYFVPSGLFFANRDSLDRLVMNVWNFD